MEKDSKQFLIQGDVYEVEKLVGIKIVKGKKLYRVRWRGYGKESDTLEPEENLLSCKDMILELEEKMKDKRRSKREFRGQSLLSKSSIDEISKYSADVTWQASEVQQSPCLKDTFWRDFDEGKINIPDQDMYSKVKERASRTLNVSDNSKSPELGLKEIPPPPLCPKVVLKRKPCTKPDESLAYRSTLKKPVSLHVKKRKKYDILRDYRRRKSRVHRKRNANENRQNKTGYRTSEKSDNFNAENGMNILQELLINDDVQGSNHMNLNGGKMSLENVSSSVPKNRESHKKSKEYYCEERTDSKKNHPLMCRITIHDKSKGLYSPYKQNVKSVESVTVHKNPVSNFLDYSAKKAFYALLDAAMNEQLEKVEKLCSNQSVINYAHEDGTTVLMVAAKLGLYNVAKILLKANAHKDKQNKRGETALMLACKNKHPKIAKLLLEYGANFAIINAEGVNVLRIANQYAGKTVLHSIVVEHVMRIVSEFEEKARSVIEHIAEIKYALFPIQCFSLNEGPKYSINFHHHVKLESPGKSGKQNLLFIANSTIKGSSIQCLFDADSVIHQVSINGVKQELFQKGEYSVFKMSGLQNGNNKVCITTHHYPESEMKLIVCAYRVHRSISWFPAQKLKSEFVD